MILSGAQIQSMEICAVGHRYPRSNVLHPGLPTGCGHLVGSGLCAIIILVLVCLSGIQYRQEYITPQSVQRLIQLCIGSWSSGIGSLRHNTVHICREPGESRVLLDQKQWCPASRLALRWCVCMTSEDPIPLDQDPTQSWIGVAHSGGYVLLVPVMPV